jgi:hypothetical protein
VLERAFEISASSSSIPARVRPAHRFEHGLGGFARDFDAGRYGLLA